MEQRKTDINNGDGNVVNVDTNGLSYSFDFSNQVANSQQSAPVTPEAQAPITQEQNPVMPEAQAPIAQEQTPVMPEMQVQTNIEQNKEEDTSGETLIKDKKATKAFLIVLFAFIVAFILFLPSIYEFVSSNIG